MNTAALPGSPANRLAGESSPYLLQHAGNPVDWYPWGEEAFARARREEKPVFLSIGYSTCHWCHVMAHESFEDAEIAFLLNQSFISIKADREERPDIDHIYMTFCQNFTGSGGWPLTVFLTPDREPFFAGTYFPKTGRGGRPGLMELLPRIQELWRSRRAELTGSAQQMLESLRQRESPRSGPSPGENILQAACHELEHQYDSLHGGFGQAPKFPTPGHLFFLLRYWKKTGSARALEMVETTLRKMRAGGIYDQAGFGFHRYSTSRDWRLPHFEKMLYDQALLAMAYCDACQATGRSCYARTVREILTYTGRDLAAPEGGFYSAEDADSEGLEGKFYLWTWTELKEALPGPDFQWLCHQFRLLPEGNFHDEAAGRSTGLNILCPDPSTPPDHSGVLTGLAGPEDPDHPDHSRWVRIRERLLELRASRTRPHLDDKILTDWNGLMITALARAGLVLDEPALLDSATRTARFLLTQLRTPDGRLLHRYRHGQAGIPAMLDDYAFFIQGLLELYAATLDPEWLAQALELNRQQQDLFQDPAEGGFFFTPANGETLIIRQKIFFDGAIPAGQSVALANLVRLSRLTGEPGLLEQARSTGQAAARLLALSPSGFTALLASWQLITGPSTEVILTGDPGHPLFRDFRRLLRQPFHPGLTVLHVPADFERTPFFRSFRFLHDFPRTDRPVAFVCHDHVCRGRAEKPAALQLLLSQALTG